MIHPFALQMLRDSILQNPSIPYCVRIFRGSHINPDRHSVQIELFSQAGAQVTQIGCIQFFHIAKQHKAWRSCLCLRDIPTQNKPAISTHTSISLPCLISFEVEDGGTRSRRATDSESPSRCVFAIGQTHRAPAGKQHQFPFHRVPKRRSRERVQPTSNATVLPT